MELKRILIGDKTYPIKIDLNVLAELQELYGTVGEFERKLLGYDYAKAEDGTQKYSKTGEPLVIKSEPSIRAIVDVLPLMIQEGMAIEAAEKGTVYEPITKERIIAECNIDYTLLSEMIHEEFARCFVTKK